MRDNYITVHLALTIEPHNVTMPADLVTTSCNLPADSYLINAPDSDSYSGDYTDINQPDSGYRALATYIAALGTTESGGECDIAVSCDTVRYTLRAERPPALTLDYRNGVLSLDDATVEFFNVPLSPAHAGELAHGIVLAFGADRVTIHPGSDPLLSLAQQQPNT